jgi:hypothetical protein
MLGDFGCLCGHGCTCMANRSWIDGGPCDKSRCGLSSSHQHELDFANILAPVLILPIRLKAWATVWLLYGAPEIGYFICFRLLVFRLGYLILFFVFFQSHLVGEVL